jgi:DNA repair exonuclease SbcCD ATPase subunit
MELNGLQQQQKEEASLEWLAMRDKSAIEAAARRKDMMHKQQASLRRSGIDPRKFAAEAKTMAQTLGQARDTIRQGVEVQRNAMQAAVEIDRDRMVDEEEERREMEKDGQGVAEQQVGEAGMVKTDWMRLWEMAQKKDGQRFPRHLATEQQRGDSVLPGGALRDSDR